jgi:hypothetical protein
MPLYGGQAYLERRKEYSVVGIATGYGRDDRGIGVRVPVMSRISSSPKCPDRILAPPSLLANGFRGQSDWDVELTTHLQLVPRSRKRGSMNALPHMPLWCSG